MYPTNNHYGVKGFYMDFKGGDPADLAKKMKFLKETNWIDSFTKAVTVKWTILNQWDKQFYSVVLTCETPGLGIRRCTHEIENVAFPERTFDAFIDEKG